jgi:class 3 adenylate cyclase/tetratricopeptide (TPR) repeat protein
VLSLEADCLWIDLQALQAAVAVGDAATAVALYQGDLLEEDRFEPWSEEPRELLRMQVVNLLLDWAAQMERRGDRGGASVALDRVIQADPLNEDAHLGLVRIQAQSGHRHLALRTYRRLEDRLRDELGVEPSVESRQLYDDILAGRVESVTPTERDDEVDELGGDENRLVTAVAVDIAALTDPRRSTDPERFRRRLDEAAQGVCDVLEDWGATVERLVGGSVVAVFGVPAIHENDASRALRAALEIVDRSKLPVRIGIDTGEVIGPAGSGAKPHTLAGGTLIVASRLREAARPDTILAGDRTCRSAATEFAFADPIDLVVAPGEPHVRARRVLSTMSGVPRPADPPFVGRQIELNAIAGLFDDVVNTGHPRLVTVIGPAGVGKSRLTREVVAAAVARHPSVQVLVGRCLSAGHGITYWALGEVLHQVCGISLDDSADVAGAKLQEGLHRSLSTSGLAEEELEATVFALATTAAISLPGNPLDSSEPKVVADELGRAWPRFVAACAVHAATVLVIEDLHWAGDAMLDMLEKIASRGDGPFMVLGTARAEFVESHPGFGGGLEGLSTISLRPLSDADSITLLRRLTSNRQLPEQVSFDVLGRAEGNPFFLEQLVLHLADDADSLPDALYSLLAARIDALPTAEKRTLQEAAVVGRIFWAAALTETLAGADLGAALLGLERRGLILLRPRSSLAGQPEYAFKHALLRDVAYASLPTSRRVRAHASVSEWIELVAGDRLEEFVELIAFHDIEAAAGNAGLRQRAFDHALMAGATARRRSAVGKALELDEQALRLSATDEERMQALEALGDDCESGYLGDDGRRYYEQALTLARSRPTADPARTRLCTKFASLMAMSPGSFRVSPDPNQVDQLIEEGLAVAGDEVSRARLLVVKGASARLWQGSEPFGQGTQPDPAPIEDRIAAVHVALAVAEAHGLDDLVERANYSLGILYGIAGRYGEALQLAERQLERVEEIRTRQEAIDVMRSAAVLTITIKGDFETGLEIARRCYNLSRDTVPHERMHATWPMLAALYHMGRWAEMWPLADEHVAAFEKEPAIGCFFVRDGPVIAASALVHMGQTDRARTLAAIPGDPMDDPETASAWQAWYAVVSGDPATGRQISAPKALRSNSYGPQHGMALIEALVALEDWAALEEFLPHARAAAAGNGLLVPFCDRASGLLAGAAGDHRVALGNLRRAVEGFNALRHPFEAARTLEALAGFSSDGGALLQVALESYVRLGALPRAAAVRSKLG